MNEGLKTFLIENINNFDILDNLEKYLKTYNQPKSKFNTAEYRVMVYYLMKEYHDNIGLRNLYKDDKRQEEAGVLDTIPKNMDLKKFYREIESIKANHPSLLLNNRFLRKTIGSGGWNYIYSNLIRGDEIHPKTLRIYLAVDNSCLNRFAILLTEECKKNNIDYYFKISYFGGNEDFDENQYDNAVIYLNEEELPGYMKSIQTVLDNHPEIKTNQCNLLGYKYDKDIVITPDMEEGTNAYSSIVCSRINELRDNSSNKVEFIGKVEEYINSLLDAIQEMCEKSLNSTRENRKL